MQPSWHKKDPADMLDIIQIVNDAELDEWAELIRRSFQTVADEFKLTVQNAPTNPAFIEKNQLKRMLMQGIELFGVSHNLAKIGFVAIEKATDEKYYLEKLAVLPEYRHKKFGTSIMDFVFDNVKRRGGKIISIAIINEHSVLKSWYIQYGFNITRTKRYEHLPFEVCFLEKIL